MQRLHVAHLSGKVIVKSWRDLETTVTDYSEPSGRGQRTQIPSSQTFTLGVGKE